MIFYDTVIKTITKTIKDRINKLNNRILQVENTSLLFATKREVEQKIGRVHEMIDLEKIGLLKTLDEKLSSVASLQSVLSLAKGVNDRLDNMYYAMEVTKTQAINQATEAISSTLSEMADKIAGNTSEIEKNRQETSNLKSVVDTLVPEIVRALDTTSLTSIVESLVQAELQSLEERMRSEMQGTDTTNNTEEPAPSTEPVAERNYANIRLNLPVEDAAGFQLLGDGYSYDLTYSTPSASLTVHAWLPNISMNMVFINSEYSGAGELVVGIIVYKENTSSGIPGDLDVVYTGTIGSILVNSQSTEYVLDNRWIPVDIRNSNNNLDQNS